jgi:hypothetical protein
MKTYHNSDTRIKSYSILNSRIQLITSRRSFLHMYDGNVRGCQLMDHVGWLDRFSLLFPLLLRGS